MKLFIVHTVREFASVIAYYVATISFSGSDNGANYNLLFQHLTVYINYIGTSILYHFACSVLEFRVLACKV